jgi:hypothetical protein
MTRLVFIFSFFVYSNEIAFAQIEKSNYVIGGNAGIDNITNVYGNSQTTFFVNPMYGSFLTDRFLIGGSANLSHQITTFNSNTLLKIGPLVRYYFKEWFLQADYSFGVPARNYIEQDVFARVGYAYFLNEHVAIEPYAYAGLRRQVYRRSSGNNYLDDGIYLSIQVYLESNLNKALKTRKGTLKGKP